MTVVNTGTGGAGYDTGSHDALRQSLARLLAADRRLRSREQHGRTDGLTHNQLRALFILTREHEATVGALAKAAELNPASVTAMIDQLEARELVQRRRDTQDRRQCWISLTEAGRQQVEATERYWQARIARTFADITAEEVRVATKVVGRIADVMETLGTEED